MAKAIVQSLSRTIKLSERVTSQGQPRQGLLEVQVSPGSGTSITDLYRDGVRPQFDSMAGKYSKSE